MRLRRAVLLDAEDTEIGTIDVPDSGSLLDPATSQQQQKQEREFHRAVQPGSPISALLKSAREPLLVSKSPLRLTVTNGRDREREAVENRPPMPANSKALLKKLSAVSTNGAEGAGKPSLSSTTTPFPPPPPVHDIVEHPTYEKPHQRLPSSGLGVNGVSRVRSASGASSATAASSATRASSRGIPPSPVRQPLQSLQPLPSLQEEQEEARRQYDLASQKARIVKQMAVVNEADGETEGAAPVVARGVRSGATRERQRERDVDRENQRETQPPAQVRAPSERREAGKERERERERDVPVGKGLADDEIDGVKPIRERKVGHKSKGSIGELLSMAFQLRRPHSMLIRDLLDCSFSSRTFQITWIRRGCPDPK